MEEAPEDERLAASGDGMGVDRRNVWLMRPSCVCHLSGVGVRRVQDVLERTALCWRKLWARASGRRRTALEREAVRDAWVARLRAGVSAVY